MGIGCGACNCQHNAGGKCGAQKVHVKPASNDAFCGSYVDNAGDSISGAERAQMSSANSQTPSVALRFKEEYGDMPRVECTMTRCDYNRGFTCTADDVEIDFDVDEYATHCNTYRNGKLELGSRSQRT